MVSPAQKRFDSVMAAMQGEDSPLATQSANHYELMLMQLSEHRRALKSLQSIDRKIQAKKQFLPEYEAYLNGVLTGRPGVQDEVLTTLMLWCIDVADIEGALGLAAYAIEFDLAMPDRFERSLPCVVAEEVADIANKLLDSETPITAELLHQTLMLLDEHDMYDEVKAKLVRQYGQAMEAEGHLEKALEAYNQALKLNEKVGVKKLIEKITRTLKNSK